MTELLPEVGILPVRLKRYPQQFGYPAFSYLTTVHLNSRMVGQVSYGLNPLNDRLYIHRMMIKPEFQRQHLGLATLCQLYLEYLLPMVPIGEPHPFWQEARKRLGDAILQAELPRHGLDQEARRWQHLVREFNEKAAQTLKSSPPPSPEDH